VYLGNKKLCKSTHKDATDFISAAIMKQYFHKKHRIHGSEFQNVDWEAMERATRRTTKARHRWIVKHAAGICAVNKIMMKRGSTTTTDCPRCGEHETSNHVTQCQQPAATEVWNKSIGELQEWLLSANTDPAITNAICEGLAGWHQALPIIPTDQATTKQQNSIGWGVFLEGGVGTEWQNAQSRYFCESGSPQRGLRWTVALILKLWQVAWNMWEHRNSILHEQKLQLELETINIQVGVMIEQCKEGRFKSIDFEGLINPEELKRVAEGTCIYKKTWIHHIESRKNRLARKIESSQEIRGMRLNMRNFLAQTT
jgi:hypothetical protein